MYQKHSKFLFYLAYSVLLLSSISQEGALPGLQRKNPVSLKTSSYSTKILTLQSWIDLIKKLPTNIDKIKGLNLSHDFKRPEYYKDSAFDGINQNSHDKTIQHDEFRYVLFQFLYMQRNLLKNDNNWSMANNGKVKPDDDFFNIEKNHSFPNSFFPFVQKLIAKPGDKFFMRGDLHGDIHSLITQIEEMKNKKIIDDDFRLIYDNVWMVFLGDYVDRGSYGLEVIYTILRLALANPDRVVLIRGNHEDLSLNDPLGFSTEIATKMGNNRLLKIEISWLYEYLPVAFYLGCIDDHGITNFLQCCHGGLEVGYDPKNFLDAKETKYQMLGFLNYKSNIEEIIKSSLNQAFQNDLISKFYPNGFSIEDSVLLKHPQESKYPSLGFLWGDFNVLNLNNVFFDYHRCSFQYGKDITEKVLLLDSSSNSIVRGVLRAHQHTNKSVDPMMQGIIHSNGIYKLWKQDMHNHFVCERDVIRSFDDGLVWTFNVGPDSIYGLGCMYDFDTYAMITPQEKYKDWTMQVINTSPLNRVVRP